MDTPPSQQNSLKPHNRWLTGLLVVVLIAAGFYRLGYTAGKKGLVFQAKTFQVVNQQAQGVTVDYSLLWDALKVVNDKYIDKGSIDQQKVLYGAIQGAVSAAGDQYTEFFNPDELK